MAILLHEPVNHLDEGNYTGVIDRIQDYSEKGYLIFSIQVDRFLLSVCLSTGSKLLWDFALPFMNADGEFDEKAVIGKRIDFSVKDKSSDKDRSVLTNIKILD